jgi:type IV pilus biogenesis protein CpaD/CtpE
MNKIIIAFAAAAALAGCAKRPDAIVQADIPMAAYTNLSCQALAVELRKEQVKLDGLSKQQISAANGDAFGVFLVGVPIGSVAGGDKEGEVAVSKGKVSAMQSAGLSKGCKLPG